MSGSAEPARNEVLWHRFGIGLSMLCLLHCLVLPLLLAGLPLTVRAVLPDSLRDNEWLHAALILPVLLVSAPVLLRGKPGRWQTGLVLVAFAALIGALFCAGEVAEQVLTVTGAAVLLAAHLARLARGHQP